MRDSPDWASADRNGSERAARLARRLVKWQLALVAVLIAGSLLIGQSNDPLGWLPIPLTDLALLGMTTALLAHRARFTQAMVAGLRGRPCRYALRRVDMVSAPRPR
jgi:hypothetical protein